MSGTTKGGAAAGFFGASPVCFGMLHRSETPSAQGVVVVSDFGYRGMCVYWTFRRLAQRLAAAGVTVLRYDLPGTGDSPEAPPNRVDAWAASLEQAIAHLAAGGMRRMTVVGFGVGALLALDAASRDERVAALELIQPFESGSRYLDFLDAPGQAVRETKPLPDGRLVSDHFLSLGEVASLRKLGAAIGPRTAPLSVTLVPMEGDDAAAIETRLVAAGHRCARLPLQDGATWLDDPMTNAVPAFFDGIVARVGGPALGGAARSDAAGGAGAGTGDGASDGLALRPRHAPRAAGYAETALAIASAEDTPMHAVLATPARTESPRALVVLFGTAANRRSGMHDCNTHWARAIAAAGVATLRFDASGFGDSDPRPGFRDNEVLVARNHEDGLPVLAAMRERGFRVFGVMGLSSGGFSALRLMLDDASVRAYFGVNTARFVAETLEQARRQAGKASNFYLKAIVDPATWSRLLKGGVDVRTVAGVLLVRVRKRVAARVRSALGRLRSPGESGAPVVSEAHRNVQAVLARPHSRVHLVYAKDDQWAESFEAEFGPRGERLRGYPNCTVTFLPNVDHGLSAPEDAARVGAMACALFSAALADSALSPAPPSSPRAAAP